MSVEEIEQTYAPFPREAIPEIMKVASEALDACHVSAFNPIPFDKHVSGD